MGVHHAGECGGWFGAESHSGGWRIQGEDAARGRVAIAAARRCCERYICDPVDYQ